VTDNPVPFDRRIRSFVMRAGRMTEGQQRGWDEGFLKFGLNKGPGCVDWDSLFQSKGPRIIEIGFGMGDSLIAMAEANQQNRYIGIEVHRPGVGRLLSQAMDRGIDNIRVFADDAVKILESSIAPASVDGIQIYFPDPWHKKRHHKRRLIQPAFVSLLVSRLVEGGWLHLATDWQPYAEHMLEVLEAAPELANAAPAGQYSPRPPWRPETKFERRGARLGHGVWDLLFHRQVS